MFFLRKIGRSSARIGFFRPAGSPERGNTILQVIVILFILVMGIYFLSDRIIRHKNIVLQTSSVLHVRFALHSVMDYAFYAIQHRYCFDDTLLPAAGCQLSNGVTGKKSRSVERVLMSGEEAKNIANMIVVSNIDVGLEPPFKHGSFPMNPGPPPTPNSEAIRSVDTMDVVMPAKNINSLHPLYLILEPLYRNLKAELKGVELQVHLLIVRDSSATIPTSGNEVHFKVTVTFEDESGKVLKLKSNPLQPSQSGTPLEVVSYGTFYPREVGTFALMVPRDLYLDGGSGPLSPGDIAISSFGTNGWTGGGKGLVFKSPVFINQNIHLPKEPSGDRQNKNSVYSPVSFADRVVLGNGKVYEGLSVYKPSTAGGSNDVLWSNNKLFGGFKLGVLIDGAYDLGLQTFGKVIPGIAVDKTLMEQCIAREQLKSTTAEIMKSELYGNLQNPAPPPGATLSYRFGLTRGNGFNPQNNPLQGVSFTGWDSSSPGRVTTATNGALLRVIVRMTGDAYPQATAQMPANATFTLYSNPIDPTPIKTARDAISATPITNPTDPNFAAYDLLDQEFNKAQAAHDQPGKITITTKPVFISSTPAQAQNHLLDVDIKIENPLNFMVVDPAPNKYARRVAPQIEFLAYDPLYQNSVLVSGGSDNPKMTRFLNFKLTDDTLLGGAFDPAKPVPNHFSDTNGGAEIADADAPYAGASPSYDGTDYVDFDNKCTIARGAATGQSFGAAAWNRDYSPSTTASWNFAYGPVPVKAPTGPMGVDDTVMKPCDHSDTVNCKPSDPAYDPDVASYRWNAYNAKINPTVVAGVPTNRDAFLPYSILEDCVIEHTAELVAGFFMCHNLVIEHRIPGVDKELTIIGTIITRDITFASVGSRAQNGNPAIALSEFKDTMLTGITWMSLYHPEAVAILRTARLLRPANPVTGDCTDVTSLPIWATTASSLQQQQNTLKCNVVSLRATANPMQWTSVDPDCGFEPSATNSTCKYHPVNFLVMEHGRGGGP